MSMRCMLFVCKTPRTARPRSLRQRKLALGLASALLAAAITASLAAAVFDGALRTAAGAKADVSTQAAAAQRETSAALARQIEADGAVLLQNKENTLPLSADTTRVNVFGWASTQWLGSGSGSGRVTKVKTDFLQALTDAGIAYNTELTEMYRDFLAERPFAANAVGTMNTRAEESCRLYEPSVADAACYSPALLANAKAYSDTAIVVIARFAGESNDCPKAQYKQTEKGGTLRTDTTRTYLELSTEEQALLAYVGANYAHVVVVLNTPNTMALGPIETTPGVNACLLAGCTGEAAAGALPDLLYGRLSPSGRTADTYAYEFSTAASYANAGAQGVGAYTGAQGLYPADGITKDVNAGDNTFYNNVSYLDYAEGIYVGYKWYETADAEGYWDKEKTAFGTGYAGVVQYPFGYGLSYTSFSWEVENLPKDGGTLDPYGTLSFRVKVTNTGALAGREVLELYDTPPYTLGGIEKAAVNLAAYAKTSLLAPGESEIVTLSFAAEDMASYDYNDRNENGFCGYELEAGAYTLSLRHDAHTPEPGASACLTLGEDTQYPNDPVTGSPVQNRFTGEAAADGVSLDGSDSGAEIVFLTRADFAGTFPKMDGSRVMTDSVAAQNRYMAADAQRWDSAQEADAPTTGAQNDLKIEENGEITPLGESLGKDYDDPQWDAVLDELTDAEMEKLALHAYTGTGALPSVGKPQTKEVDGPSQIGGFNQIPGTGFPNAAVLAQTWDTALARQFGRTVGIEAGQLGYTGWYAPGVNLHRSPFGGRNYEYYSEDSLLSGSLCAEVVSGSLDAGVYCYVKHLVSCDQETARDGIYVWMTEQALRELYLKPFQMAVEYGGATGLMTAYGRLGAVWAGGSSALLTDVVRGEWGFHGAILTDYSDHPAYMNADQALRAGGDLWMDGVMHEGRFAFPTAAPRFRQALRRAAKDTLYMYLNAHCRNAAYNAACAAGSAPLGGAPIVKPKLTPCFPFWVPLLAALDLLAAGAFAACLHGLRQKDGACAHCTGKVENEPGCLTRKARRALCHKKQEESE